jgi:chitin disaccharide deacetylase
VQKLLASLPEGTTELMCHPGYADEALERSATRLQQSRQAELEILTDKDIRKSIAELGIRLINYQEISTSGT